VIYKAAEQIRIIPDIKTDGRLPYLSDAIPAGIRIMLEQILEIKRRVPISVWLNCRWSVKSGCNIPAPEKPRRKKK
jgi:hypothetical protein